LLVVGCESTPQDSSQTSGTGAAGGAGGVTSQPIGSARPGSQEDFVVNVGDRVFFDFDKFDLKPEARTTLQRQAEWLKRYPTVTVSIEGHADERGTREYNLALGERRANSVRTYLTALGIDAGRVRTISYGKERPVALGSNEEAWAQNRRAVTVVTVGRPLAQR
jgi:peptidoglycan-associated lipoprotein